MTFRYFLLLLFASFLFSSCHDYKKDLESDDKTKIMKACYELGEAKDVSAVKPLLTKIIDGRISNNLRFKGMCVYQCRIAALSKISGINISYSYKPDTTVVNLYIDWAIKKGYVKDREDIDLYYSK